MSTDTPHQITITGHVNDGKSTLVGRLLYQTGSVPEHVIEQHCEEPVEKSRGGFEFTNIMDNLASDPSSGKVPEEDRDVIQSSDTTVVTDKPQASLSIERSSDVFECRRSASCDLGQTIAVGTALEVNERDLEDTDQ